MLTLFTSKQTGTEITPPLPFLCSRNTSRTPRPGTPPPPPGGKGDCYPRPRSADLTCQSLPRLFCCRGEPDPTSVFASQTNIPRRQHLHTGKYLHDILTDSNGGGTDARARGRQRPNGTDNNKYTHTHYEISPSLPAPAQKLTLRKPPQNLEHLQL